MESTWLERMTLSMIKNTGIKFQMNIEYRIIVKYIHAAFLDKIEAFWQRKKGCYLILKLESN